MKYIKFFEAWFNRSASSDSGGGSIAEEPSKKPIRKENYMFRDMHLNRSGTAIFGICKFCEKTVGHPVFVDIADHTNICSSVPGKKDK